MDILFGLLPADMPFWARVAISGITCAALLVGFMALGPLLYVYAETKIAGFMQDRIGPKRVGPHGMLQWAADALKLMIKEDITPKAVDKLLFRMAPYVVMCGAFACWVALPYAPHWSPAGFNIGILYRGDRQPYQPATGATSVDLRELERDFEL